MIFIQKKGRLRGLFTGDESMMLYRMAVLNVFALAAKAAAYHHKEDRNEEDSQNRCGDHPAHYAGAYSVLRAGTCARADNQRHNTEDKRQRRHQDRA